MKAIRTAIVDEKRRCPKRGKAEHQIHVGFNASGTQRCKCKDCNIRYTVEPRQHEDPEETNETRENVYILLMVSREPRQIAGHAVTQEKPSKYIQEVVDNAPEAKRYFTDGHSGYLDVVFLEEHIRNIHDKRYIYCLGRKRRFKALYSCICQTEQVFLSRFRNIAGSCRRFYGSI